MTQIIDFVFKTYYYNKCEKKSHIQVISPILEE